MKTKLPKWRIEAIESNIDALGPAHRAVYDEMIADGESPTMAEMLITQTCAGVTGTDSSFNKVEHERMSGMGEGERETITSIARKAGINTTGKSFNGQLGTYSDPAAWISGTHDVRKVCESKGLSVQGMVNVTNPVKPKKIKEGEIAPDILNRIELRERAKNPLLNKKCEESPGARKELRKQITKKHGYKRPKL